MDSQEALIEDLKTLNRISETLNQSADVQSALNSALASLVHVMGLESGWVFLVDPLAVDQQWGPGFKLAAHHNLPPALSLDQTETWNKSCECQDQCKKGEFIEAYNEIRCTRLSSAQKDRRGLALHASTPLRTGNRILGILNVAAEDGSAFTPRALALLTNVGAQMGVAIERAQLFDMLRERRIDEQAALLNFSNQLLTYRDTESLTDYLVQEVSSLLKMDACALVLTCDDPSMLRFRSAYGWMNDPVRSLRKIPSDTRSGPGQVMQSKRPLLVEDLQVRDPTHWAPDWLRAENFRGHAVLPLIAEDDAIGALVINDRKSRLITEDELRFLQLMANQAAIAIESSRLREEERTRQRLEEEMAVGRQIQLDLLPETTPSLPGWEIDAKYHAAHQMGGDFYDFLELSQSPPRLGIVIADVSDKGVPAALFMAMCRTMIRSIAFSGRSPAQTFLRTNELMLKESRANLFLSAMYIILEPESGRLVYANGGHSRPLLYRSKTEEITELRSDGIILGTFEEISIEEKEITISPGDVLLFYTDGVPDATDATGALFGTDPLLQIIADHKDGSAKQIADTILESINHFTGSMPQTDDLTILVLKRLPTT
jgi:sigma-B regulation protein RsbU (phosphoserine phosphatase)